VCESHARIVQSLEYPGIVLAVFGYDVSGNRDDVLRSLPERRQADRNHVEAKEQILAKTAFCNTLAQIAIRRRDNPGVENYRLSTTNAPMFLG
jgi:hypothetical protein